MARALARGAGPPALAGDRTQARRRSLRRGASASQAHGRLALLDAEAETLAEFVEEWRRLHAEPNLAPRTLAVYASLRDVHVLPELGALPLRQVTPEACQRFAGKLAADGVGPAARRKALALLSGVLQRAVEWRRIPVNPVRSVRKPSARRVRVVRPIAPVKVEALRGTLLAADRLLDATLVSVLAYAGLRSGEALGLTWGDVGNRTLVVKAEKTGRRRSVRLLGR